MIVCCVVLQQSVNANVNVIVFVFVLVFNLRKERRTSEESPAPALLAQGLGLTKHDCQMEEFCLCVNDSALIGGLQLFYILCH